MSDNLYLSLWLPEFDAEQMLPAAVSAMAVFPYAAVEPGVHYVSVQPINWAEGTLFERRFTPPAKADEAAGAVAEFAASDFCISFEAFWELWSPVAEGGWQLAPQRVVFHLQGRDFDEGACEESGHIRIDLGLDEPFLGATVELDELAESRLKLNVAKLVEFTKKLERGLPIASRALMSDSGENLAAQIMARLEP